MKHCIGPIDSKTARRILRVAERMDAYDPPFAHGEEQEPAAVLVEAAMDVREKGYQGRERSPGISAAILSIYYAGDYKRDYSGVRG